MSSIPEADGAATNFQPKLIYLARRNPALTRESFVTRWRQHGALGMSRPRWRNVARYVHCDVLHPPVAPRGVADEFDGIGLIWHRSPAARAAHLADTSSRDEIERDELETFAEPVVNFCLLARERVLMQPAVPSTSAFKLARFLRARARDSARELPAALELEAPALRERLRKTVDAAPVGHVLDEVLPPESGDRWGLLKDCVEELWFDSLEAASRAAEALDAAELPVIEAVTVLTNEVVLYEG